MNKPVPTTSQAGSVERQVPCPACRQPAVYGPSNVWRPFCSQRCRHHDLGAWASEKFRMPADPPAEDVPDSPAGH